MNRTPSLCLATPCYAGLAHALYARSLLALGPACAARGVSLEIDLGGGEALIGRARAAMLANFVAGEATHLLFVDADIGFEPEAVFRLLAAGRDIVGGVYPRKSKDAGYEVGPPLAPEDGDGFQPVAYVGAGLLLISRAAAERMTASYTALHAGLADLRGSRARRAAMVFDPMIEPETGRYLADHQAFCRRWRDLGGTVWADLRTPLVHVGAIEYSGPPPRPSEAQAD